MFRKISALILTPPVFAAVSLAAAVLLLALAFTLGSAHAPPEAAGGSASAYAVLTTDESAPDRELAEALSIIVKGQVYSESSQWVFLDDFGELRRIPLDEYSERLESFDPRNDGYAERVRSFFVRDGKRFFFIPRNSHFWGSGKGDLEKDIAAALGRIPGAEDVSWSLAYGNQRRKGPLSRPWGIYLVLFAVAALMGLFRLKPRLLWAALFPVLGGLCLFGTPGFALAAILSLLPDLLAEPVRELCYVLSAEAYRFKRGESRSRLLQNNFVPYFSRWMLFPLLVALYGFAALIARIPPVLAVLTFFFFALVFFFFFMVEANRTRAGDHLRFVPVLILKSPLKRPAVSRAILPFALASCLAFLFAALPGLPDSGGTFASGFEEDIPSLISAAEYRAHADYQQHFSLMPLRGGFDEPSYFHYDVDKDGLIVKAKSSGEAGLAVIPPFPLESLMEFLGNPASAETMRDMSVFELIPALPVLLLCIPAISGGGRGTGKKKGPAIYNDKRIAA